MKLSKWIDVDGYCATRVIYGTDPQKEENRVAFIEKTPRICLSKRFENHNFYYGLISKEKFISHQAVKSLCGCYSNSELNKNISSVSFFKNQLLSSGRDNFVPDESDGYDFDIWIYGQKGSSEYGKDIDSRKWCDNMLKLLGYELTNK